MTQRKLKLDTVSRTHRPACGRLGPAVAASPPEAPAGRWQADPWALHLISPSTRMWVQ